MGIYAKRWKLHVFEAVISATIHGVFTAVSKICAVLELCEIRPYRFTSVTNGSVANASRCVKSAQRPDKADVVGVQNVHIDWTICCTLACWADVNVAAELPRFQRSYRIALSNAGVGNAGESIRAFSHSSSTAYISLTVVKTPCTYPSAFNGLENAFLEFV